MLSDLHIHTLSHKYFFDMADGFSEVVLDDEDKHNIEAVVNWCCHDRGLSAIAITDHEMIQPSLYAADYVKKAGLPIEIITGAECAVRDPHSNMWFGEVHLLCLGIDKLPRYGSRTPVDRMVSAVHDAGGFVIMAHPVVYPDSFYRYCHLLGGYEYRNSNKHPFDEGKRFVASNNLSIREFNNSDFHYSGAFPNTASSALHSNHDGQDALNGI
jgi:predicted metal-dependent phosphoesterase TrpH